MFSESDVKNMFDVSEEEHSAAENSDRLHEEQIHKHWSKVALSVKFLDARFRYQSFKWKHYFILGQQRKDCSFIVKLMPESANPPLDLS